jgi:hypothetical protein
VNAGGILSVGDFRFAVPPSIHAVRIHGDAHGLSGWNCWECQAPGTPILDRVRPPWLFLPGEGRVGVNGLGVTLNRACNSQLRSYSVRIRRSSTGSDYCSVAWGGGGRHRRTRQNHSVLACFLFLSKVACYLKLWIEISV